MYNEKRVPRFPPSRPSWRWQWVTELKPLRVRFCGERDNRNRIESLDEKGFKIDRPSGEKTSPPTSLFDEAICLTYKNIPVSNLNHSILTNNWVALVTNATGGCCVEP